MAQRHTRGFGKLARRYGLVAKSGVAMACVALILVLGVVAAIGNMQRTSFSISTHEDESIKTEDDSRPMEETSHQEVSAAEPVAAVVHVDGAVESPGVYVLEGDSLRVNDAITMAGGLLPNADTSSINLAATLEDGQKVHVPMQGEVVAPTVTPTSAEAPQPAGSARINVNTASEEQLQELPGVGEATARSIVEDREQNGPFTSPEDLMRVTGIGEKKFEKMRDMVDV